MIKYLYTLIASVLLPLGLMAQFYSLAGFVKDARGLPLSNANVEVLNHPGHYGLSDDHGYFEIQHLPSDTYKIKFSHISFKPIFRTYKLDKNRTIDVAFSETQTIIEEVYVTARESKNISSSSIINRQAMQHLQPSSFTDILELLPGGRTANPSLAKVNGINLRSADQNSTYSPHSLGTMFNVDGITLNSQSLIDPVSGFGLSENTMHRNRGISNIGVDMRGISTDNIESVEIIRGIPSVEYGNLTSGVVLIERIKGYEPWSARIKADGFSKLFSLGKGFDLKNYKLNADAAYLLSNSDITDVFNQFKRINTSIRGEKSWKNRNYQFIWAHQIDFNTTLDDERVDPDNDFQSTDSYKNNKHFLSVGNTIKFYRTKLGDGLKNASLSLNLNYSNNQLEIEKLVQASTGSILMNSLVPGSHQSDFSNPTYVGYMTVDDRPMDVRAKVLTNWSLLVGVKHQIKLGAEYAFAKNLGAGQNYDLDRPISANINARPRNFSEIPSMNTISIFAEDRFFIKIAGLLFENSLGLRSYMLTNLDSKFDVVDKLYTEPRYNGRLYLGTMNILGKKLKTNISGGFGLQILNPTQNYLYPNLHYLDRPELSYYHNNSNYRLAWGKTIITDPTNYAIQPSKNKKWELGAHFDLEGNFFSITYFKEKMNNGFRSSNIYHSITFRKYDVNSVDPNAITQAPVISDFNYEDQAEYHSYNQVGNGSSMNKQGIEYQFSSKRIKGINTRFTVNGAWFRTFNRNSEPVYSTLTNVLSDGKFRQYLAVYADENSGGHDETLNTNLTADSYLPKLGLNLSISLQSLWFKSNQRLFRDDLPVGYYDIQGQYKPYTEQDRSDPVLRNFDLKIDPNLYRKHTSPIDLLMNIKATKVIKDKIKVAMFVNRLFVYKPNYTLYGNRHYRNDQAQDAPYFGMEINIKI